MPIKVRVAVSKFHLKKKKWRPWREPEIGRRRKLRARSAVEMGTKGGGLLPEMGCWKWGELSGFLCSTPPRHNLPK